MADPKRVRRARRNDSESKRPAVPFFIVIIAFSVLSVAVLAAFLVIAIRSAGNTAHILAGVGVLLMLAGIALTVVGVRRARNNAYSFSSRIAAIIAPLVSAMGWMYIYFAGAFIG